MSHKRKKILYVSRQYPADLRENDSFGHIVQSLKESYCVETYKNLDSHVVDIVREQLTNNKFDALITHVPYSSSIKNISPCRLSHISELAMTAEAYHKSLDILQQIKVLDDIPIIAYTGAGDSNVVYVVFMDGGGIDHIVHKTLDCKKDFDAIQAALTNLFHKYKEIPKVIKSPELKTKNGDTVVTARINLNGGLGLSSIHKISDECKNYKGTVVFKKNSSSEDNESYDAKSIMGTLMMGERLNEGAEITILVERSDENARRLARRLYSALSCRYSFTMDFDKFESGA